VFNKRFSAALLQFGAAFLETTEVKSTTIKGTKRADAPHVAGQIVTTDCILRAGRTFRAAGEGA